MQDNTLPNSQNIPSNLLTTEQRKAWLKEKGLENFNLISDYELIAVKQSFKDLRDQIIMLTAQNHQSCEDSDLLDFFEFLFFHYKIIGLKAEKTWQWLYAIDKKEFGPFQTIRAMLKDAIKNTESNQNGESNG